MATADLLPHETRMDVVKILENHRRECERSGDYRSAEVTRRRLLKLRQLHHSKEDAEIVASQENTLERLKREHEAKWAEFERRWAEEEFPRLERQLEQMRADLRERQAVELHRFESLQEVEKYKPHASTNLLSDKRRLEAMGAAGDYLAAKKLKAQIERREEEELLALHRSKLKGFYRREKRFHEQQASELESLENKLLFLRARKERQKMNEAAKMQLQERAMLAASQAQHAVKVRKKHASNTANDRLERTANASTRSPRMMGVLPPVR